MELTGVY